MRFRVPGMPLITSGALFLGVGAHARVLRFLNLVSAHVYIKHQHSEDSSLPEYVNHPTLLTSRPGDNLITSPAGIATVPRWLSTTSKSFPWWCPR